MTAESSYSPSLKNAMPSLRSNAGRSAETKIRMSQFFEALTASPSQYSLMTYPYRDALSWRLSLAHFVSRSGSWLVGRMRLLISSQIVPTTEFPLFSIAPGSSFKNPRAQVQKARSYSCLSNLLWRSSSSFTYCHNSFRGADAGTPFRYSLWIFLKIVG